MMAALSLYICSSCFPSAPVTLCTSRYQPRGREISTSEKGGGDGRIDVRGGVLALVIDRPRMVGDSGGGETPVLWR